MSDISDRVKKIIRDYMGVDDSKMNDEASFVDDIGADSLEVMELVVALEEEFGLEIPDHEAEAMVQIKDAVLYVENAVSAKLADK